MALSAALSAPTATGGALAVVGLALLAVRHPIGLTAGLGALGVAAGVAIDAGAAPAAAPLWGAGLLAAALLAERAIELPDDGEIEIDALIAWLAAVGTLAGGGLAAGALVLLAAHGDAGTSVAGLVAGALLAVFPARLARRVVRRRGG